MTVTQRVTRIVAALGMLTAVTACSNAGALGEALGSVLGAGQQQQGQAAQAQGAIRAVDTRAQQISLQLTNGQNVALAYDDRTKVVYQNQLYAVSDLESGDQVLMRVRDVGNGTYYTDSIHVTQSVSPSGSGGSARSGSGSANVQTLRSLR